MKIPYRIKKTLALLLALAMLLTLAPAGAVLANAGEPGGTPVLEESSAPKITPEAGKPTEPVKTDEARKTAEPEKTGDAQSTGAPVQPTEPQEPAKTDDPQKTDDAPAATPTPAPTAKPPAKTAKPEEAIEQDVAVEDELPPGSEEEQGAETPAPTQRPAATVAVRGIIGWNGFSDGAEKPVVKITLLRNGASAGGIAPILTKDASYAFTGLAKFDESGSAYSYKIKVSRINGYTVSTSGNDITVTRLTDNSADAPPADEGRPADDAAIQAVMDAIGALPAAADADPLDNTLANRVNAASSAFDALTGEQRAKIPQDLITKLDALLTLFFAPSGDIGLFAVQTDVVTVKAVWAGDIPVVNRTDVTIALSGSDAEGNTLDLSATLTGANGWQCKFTGVNALQPHVVAAGVTSGYTASVANPTGTSVTVNIQKAPAAPTDLKAKIVWSGVTASVASVGVTLYWTQPGGGGNETLTLSGGSWSGTFTQKKEDGYTFLLVPAELPGYTHSVSFNSAAGLYTVTYKRAQPTFTYSGNLVWWPSDPVTRGNISVSLVRTNDGRHMGTAVLPDGDNTFTFADVPQYMDNGSLCIYGVRATDVTGYTKWTDTGRTDGHATVYYYKADSGHFNLRVNVAWNDSNNKRGHRPIETTVYLYADGALYTGPAAQTQLQVKLADGWTGVFPNLPVKNAAGHVIKWSVHAAKVPYYHARAGGASGALAKVTYIFGSGQSNAKDTSRKLAPKVGDPAVYLAEALTLEEKAAFMREDVRAAVLNRDLAAVARANRTDGQDIDFAALQKTNRDVAAWLVADGAMIDYPVVKGANNSYYLNRLYNKEQNRSGSLFIDSGCNRNFSGRNTVIYGHHMGNGSMFAGLLEYKNQSYYDAHPTMQLYTPSKNYTVELFAAFTAGDEYDGVARLKFSGNSDFMSYLNACVRKSDIATGVEAGSGDKIITLVTCSYDYDDTRYLVMGRLVELDS